MSKTGSMTVLILAIMAVIFVLGLMVLGWVKLAATFPIMMAIIGVWLLVAAVGSVILMNMDL